MTLVYEFSRSGFTLAEMTDTLKVRGSEYELDSNAQGVGVVAMLARGQTIRRESRGAIGEDHVIADLFELVRGEKPGRTSRDELTLFKSVGMALEDLAAAELVYEIIGVRSTLSALSDAQ